MCRVLIVDDNEGVGPAVAVALQAHGYLPLVFCNVFSAVRGLQETIFDVAIVDRLTMQTDSVTLVKILRRRAPGLPVVVMSGEEDDASTLDRLNYDPGCARRRPLAAAVSSARPDRRDQPGGRAHVGERRLRISCHITAGQAAMASSRRWVTAGPNMPITTNTTTMAPAMKPNTPVVP
jgi:CheY-like chemotaxis protein